MMTPENQCELAYYARQFEDEVKNRLNFYNQTARMILTIPLFINAGAAIALASFFYKNNDPNVNIKSATIFFILGTIFGLVTLVFEFFAARFEWTHFNSYLFSFKEKTKEVAETILAELKIYYAGYSVRYKKTYGTVVLRIINGAISVIFCLLGIYYIAAYLLTEKYLLMAAAGLFLIYCIGSLIFMYYSFKHD